MKNRHLKFPASVLCACAIFLTSPVFAAQQQFICNGTHGDNQDVGVWDGIFTANTAEEAMEQAIIKFKPTGSGGYIKVQACVPLK